MASSSSAAVQAAPAARRPEDAGWKPPRAVENVGLHRMRIGVIARPELRLASVIGRGLVEDVVSGWDRLSSMVGLAVSAPVLGFAAVPGRPVALSTVSLTGTVVFRKVLLVGWKSSSSTMVGVRKTIRLDLVRDLVSLRKRQSQERNVARAGGPWCFRSGSRPGSGRP